MKFLTQCFKYSFLTFCLLFTLCYTVNCQNDSTPVATTTIEPKVNKTTISSPILQEIVNSTLPPPQKPPPALGLSCNESSVCKAEFSSCLNKTCTCLAGYINSKENLRCLKVMSKLGDDCSEDEQCSQGNKAVGPTICLNFICSCDIGMSLIDEKCQGPKVLVTNCTTDDDCTIKKSHCREGLCTCYTGFIPNSENNICLPLNLQLQKTSGNLSSGCTEDIQCQETMGDLAICEVGVEGGTCQCQPGTHLVKNQCQKYLDLGQSCSQDIDCISKDTNTEAVDSRICNQDVCSCNKGWIQEETICKSGATQNIVAAIIFPTLILFWFVQRLEKFSALY